MRWQPLEVAISMGCSISPLLFVLAMEMVLRGAQWFAEGVEVADGQVLPPMKAFMNDITVLTGDRGGTTQMLTRLQSLVQWCCIVFKSKKCRGLSLEKGSHKVVHFRISTVQEEPVKCLGIGSYLRK